MARQALAVETISITGLEPTVSAAHADGHAYANNQGRAIVTIINGNLSDDVTASIQPTDSRYGLDREPLTVIVPAGEERVIGGLDSALFEQQSGADQGKIYLDFADGDVLTDVDLKAYMLA